MARRSRDSHQVKLDRLPFSGRLRREDPMYSAELREMERAADGIAEPTGWYAVAGWRKEARCSLIHFAKQGEAAEMRRGIDESGIEKRPAPPKYDGSPLSVRRYNRA